MPPNLRPTLSNRIRASFDGKRSKSNAQKPQETNKFVVQDAATLRDAIGQAISNDTFQNAIAVHLARLIEPSIKDALDTIQPVVETVYQHDVLLRKTNRSVEDLLQRFDSAAEKEEHEPTNKLSKDVTGAEEIRQLLNGYSTQNNTKFEQLSSSVREGHGTMGKVVTDIAEIRTAMSLSSKSFKSLESTALQSTTDNFKLQEQLDELKVDISNFRKSLDSQNSTLVQINEAELRAAQILGEFQQSHASHILALNEIKAHDQSFKSASIPIFEKTHADTAAAFQTLTARLAAVNENVTASSASENDKILGLGQKIDKVLASIDTTSTNDSRHEILTAVRKSNDFHTIHVAALEGIMDKLATPDAEKDISSESGGLTSLKEQIRDIASTLDSYTNHLTAIRESDRSADILVAVHASNEYHASSAADLSEIKTATKATEQSHISHSADLSEIKAVVEAAGKSHASHTKDFGDLQASVTTASESHNSHTAALEAIRAANDNSAQGMTSQVKSLEALGLQMGTVIVTLGSQSIVHSDIRDTVHASQDAHTSHSMDLGEVKEILKIAVESHTAHARALENIKSGQQGTIEQLATHARTLDGVQAQVGTVVNNFEEQTAVHSEILDAVHASNASHTSHTTALEVIVATHKNTSAQLCEHTTTLNTVSAQLGTITTTLNNQNTTHSQLLDAVQASNTSHELHAVALDKAETMHADILSGVNGSRGLLVGHYETLASHASLLESARDAHSKDHDNIMDAVKQSHGLLEGQSGAIRGMESTHEQIRNSVQAFGGGVYLNENRLGQLRDHMKVPVGQRSEPASETAEAVHERHSLDDGKTALGLEMAAVAGGGLLTVAGSDGFCHHEGEKGGEVPLDKTSVEEIAIGAKDVDKARMSESVNELTKPVEAVIPGEPVAEVHNLVEDVTAAPEQKDQINESISIVPEEEDQVEGTLPIQRVETDQVFNTSPDKTEDVDQFEETIPNEAEEEHLIEKNTATEPTVEVADSTKGITDPAEETKPVEQVQEDVEPIKQKDSAVDEPAHEIELASKDEHVFEDSARKSGNKLAVKDQSMDELPTQEPSHEILGDEIAEKEPLHRESAQLSEFAPTPATEPEVESIQEKELHREDGPSLYEIAGKGSPLTESYAEQPIQDFDLRLEEPGYAVFPGYTIEAPTTSGVIHEESGKNSKAEHNEVLNELPLDEKTSLEEQIPRERRLSYEVEPNHDVNLAEDGASVTENTADVPIHESEIPVELGSITGEQSICKLLSARESEPKNVVEGNGDGSAPISKSTIIPQNIEESVLDSKNEQGAEEPLSEVLTVKHGEYVEHTPVKQSTIDVTPAIADKLSTDDPSSKIWQDEESQSTLENYPAMDGTILRESSMLPVVVQEQPVGEEVETKSQPVGTAQDVEEKDVRFTTFPINESVLERRSVAQDLPTVEAATEIPENVTLPMGIAKETREVPSDLVEPVAQEAGQIGDGSPATVESVYEAQTPLEAKPVLGVPSVAAGSIDELKPEMDGEQNASDVEVAHGESGLEKVGTGDKIEDGLVQETLDKDGSAVISQGIASISNDEVPFVEPVAMESAMRTRNTGTERRPTLTKRVSFKEPPAEEKLDSDKHIESGPLSTEETILEEKHSYTLLPIGDDPADKNPSGGVQEKFSTVEDKPISEDSHMNMPGMEVEPYKEEASLEKMPILASEKLAEKHSNESEPANCEILQPTIEEPYPSPKQTPEAEQAKESETIDDEPALGESDQKVTALHSSARDDVEIRDEEAKPMGDKEVNQVAESNTEPVAQHEAQMNSKKLEQFPVEEKIGESGPDANDTSPQHESTKDSRLEPMGEAELYSDHSASENFSPGDHAVKDTDEKDLNSNNSAPQKLVIETQSEEAAAEIITVRPKLVPEKVLIATHSSATEDSDVKSREEPITDELIASEVSTQDHAGDPQTVNDAKHGSVANDQIAQEPATDLPVSIDKDESGGPAAEKRSIDKPSPEDYANEPAPMTPILQASSLNDAVVDEPSILEARNENPTITKPQWTTDKSESEDRSGEPVTEFDATLAEPIIENPVLYNQGGEDLAENSMAVSATDNKLAVNGLVTEKNAVESKVVEEPVVQNLLADKNDEETKAQLEEPARETAVKEVSGTAALDSTKVDTSTNINPTEVESNQLGEASIKDQDKPTTKESTLEESALSEREVVVEGSHKQDVSSEDEKLFEKPKAENSDIEIESPAEGASLKAETVTTGVVQDAKSATVIDSTTENSDTPIETLGEKETHMEESTIASEQGKEATYHVEPETTLENEPSTKTAHAPEKWHTEDEIVPNQLPIRDQMDLPAPAHEPASEESFRHESPSNEPTDGINADKSSSTPPMIIRPTRVDSGIEIETPTEAKSASKTESLDSVVTGPLPSNANQTDPSPVIATKDLNVTSSSTEEEASGVKSPENELAAGSAIFQSNPEIEPIPDQLGDESQEATDKPLEEDQFLNTVDQPEGKMLSTATVEPNVKATSAGDWMNGNTVQEVISAEPTIGISNEKELQIDMKHSAKQQHTRMDSGKDVETPTTESFGKLQSVVEVKAASDVDPGLEGEM